MMRAPFDAPRPRAMLSAVIIARLRTTLFALALGLALAGCSGTTSGTGTFSGTTPAPARTSAPISGSITAPASGTTTGAPATPAAPATQGVHPVPSAPLRSLTVDAADGVTYPVDIWADVQDATCFDHAYGQPIVTFLTKHPCTGLRRYLGTTTVGGRPVGFAMSSTAFHGPAADPYRYAGQFTKLEMSDGTGSITDLLRDGYRLPEGPTSIPGSEAFNVVGQDEGVTVWDVWYLDGPTPTNAKPLMRMTQDLFLQF